MGSQAIASSPIWPVSLPTPTDGGKTYTFRLRRNVRYSDGRPVKASDFRRGLERSYRIGIPVAYFDAVVGAGHCRAARKRCDLSRGIITDDARSTVTFHLVAADPEFLYSLSLYFADPLPAGTPARPVRTRPVPATGPYMIESYRPGHVLRLRRNPHFREWSKAAQPKGYVDRIVVDIGGTPDQAVTDVIHGRADFFSSAQSQAPPSAGLLASLGARYASRIHTTSQQDTVGLFLNTRVPPFDRIDARRAVNYAADRAAAVAAVGGASVAQTTCQILPPNVPGYRPYCPYATIGSGPWTAPDLTRARALVARSGTRGMKVTVWSWSQLGGVGPFAVRLLRSLGYRATMKTPGKYFSKVFDSRTKAQIGTIDWASDYPAPGGFFRVLFTCASFKPHSAQRGLDLVDAAHLFAMGDLVASDAGMACMDSKYFYLFWRPITAIQNADKDGNPGTAADPAWAPLLGTPNHPEYPAAHGCLTAAFSDALAAALNTKRLDVTVPGATNGGTTLATTQHFNSVRDIQNQVADARVWIGFDYRNSAEQGLRLGNDVAGWALDRYFKPAQQLVPNEGRISPTAASCSSAMTRVARWCGA